MNQLNTTGIVLTRTNFGEADRIVTMLTPDHGKLRLMTKGVRRAKSKLAGGIELFSISDITFIRGRGDISTLVSARLKQHFGKIVEDIDRTMLGYEIIKQLNHVTEDEPEEEYFTLLGQAFAALDDKAVSQELIHTWFNAQLLQLAGHRPNLRTDTAGQSLQETELYNFSFDDMAFAPFSSGQCNAQHIKLLRLLFSSNPPQVLAQVQGTDKLLPVLTPLVQTMHQTHIR